MYLPRNLQEKMAYSFLIFMVPYIALFELAYILPRHYQEDTLQDPRFLFHSLAGCFLVFQVLSNLHQFIVQDSSIRGVFLTTGSAGEAHWRYCTVCETRCPPRSYHCSVCNVCILKRDHHCVFTGSCVGHQNQRYYLVCIFYFTFAALYASLFNLPHTLHLHLTTSGHSPLATVFIHIFPLLALLFRVITPLQCLVTFTTSVCVVGAALLVALFSFHMGLVLSNKTVYERAHRIDDYGRDWRYNMSQVFGERSLLVCILSPYSKSKLPSNGIVFPTWKHGSNGAVGEIRKAR